MSAGRPRNLLDVRPVAAVVRSPLYPAVFRWATTLVFALIMWQLLLGPQTAHDNLGTALTWVVWWPLLPIAFLLLGRLWCAICPFAWVSDQVQRLAGMHRPVPRFLKRYGIWIIDACFIAITWADHVWGIVGSPWGSGLLLLGMTTAVVASAVLWQRRAFCRYLCFLGGLAGNYSRAGAVELRANADVCAACTSRAACFNGGAAAPACPLFEFPRTMDSSANCNLCANCVKNCPHDAISISVRPPSRELWHVRKPKLSESFLAVAIMGIVLVQNLTMLDVWSELLARIERLTGTQSYSVNYTLAFAFAVAVPLAALVVASSLATPGGEVSQTFARFGYALIPLDVAAHVAHNLFHLLAEGKSVLYTALALVGHEHAGSAALVGDGTIRTLQYLLVAAGILASLYAARRIGASRPAAGVAVVPFAALIVAFGALNLFLFTLPMTMRM